MTGASAKVQRRIAKEIKRARMANLLPFTKR
jgi:ribosomal protein S18